LSLLGSATGVYVLAAITLDMFAVLLGGAIALLPIFAKDILLVEPVELGYLQAAHSIGALTMAITLTYLPPLGKSIRYLTKFRGLIPLPL
jgi:hypothetical protein